MRKIIVLSMISLDGVMQAPGGPGEDTTSDFKYGGWTAPYGDEAGLKVVQKELRQPADYLLGRKTFEIWVGYWPDHADFWPGINDGTKYVISTTLKKSDPRVVGWKNTVVIETVEDIRRLKASEGRDIQVWGSSRVIQLLLENDLVDELSLKIYAVTLGKGKKLFDHLINASSFKLTESLITTTGVIVAHYNRAGKVETGTVEP